MFLAKELSNLIILKVMKQGFVSCKNPSQLACCFSEWKYGLARLFWSNDPSDINIVASGERQTGEKNYQGPFDLIAKLGVVYKMFLINMNV